MGEMFHRADKRGDAEAERQRQYEEAMMKQEAELKAQQDALLAKETLANENMTDNVTKVEVGGGASASTASVSSELMGDTTASKSSKKKRSTSSQVGLL